MIKHNMAFCVKYLPCEVNCVPSELRYEMFRSTAEDRPYRGDDDYWMDWAVVDSVPYLYFLQYKVYSQLQRPAEQLHALNQLIWTINSEPNLCHRETALNLLGQCMEQENRMDAALCCYMMSLNVRGRNNAAKWHVCRLLARIFQCRSD
jgi:tetratricopeptide (TPR) repeat protein